jgi:hypothetical protein
MEKVLKDTFPTFRIFDYSSKNSFQIPIILGICNKDKSLIYPKYLIEYKPKDYEYDRKWSNALCDYCSDFKKLQMERRRREFIITIIYAFTFIY